MLSDYIAHRFQEIVERTYYKLVLILALTSMFSVVLSGLSLIADSSLRYLALVTLIVGFFSAKVILSKSSKKLRKLIEKFEDEARAARYFQVLKDTYMPDDYLYRISVDPDIVEPVVKNEKKRLEAGKDMLRSKYSNLETRLKIVLVATAFAIAIPHVIITKDLLLVMLAAFVAALLRKN